MPILRWCTEAPSHSNWLSFAAIVLILFYSPHPECSSVCQVGETQGDTEQGSGRRTRGWDSGGTQWWGYNSQFWYYTLSPLILIVINVCIHICIFFFNTSPLHTSLPSFSLFSWQMSLPMRRYIGLKPRKRKLWTPCAVGSKWGAPCSTGGRGTGASVGSESISFFSFGFYVAFYFFFYTPTPVLFHLLGVGSTEKGRYPMGWSLEIRNGGTAFGGWWLGEDGSSGGRFWGRGFLWASEGTNVTFLCIPSSSSS